VSRPFCRTCLRPEGHCDCADLPRIETRTRVVLLQHPREARLARCSARLAHLALPNSELHRGVAFEADARVREVCARPGAALLYPGAAPRAGAPVDTLVAVDGTWAQAAKMLKLNPSLAALPRVSLRPARPSGYGDLRREPAPDHLSTLEAVALALGELEGSPERFEPLVDVFRRGVERQLAIARGARRSPRHRG
jgi:DTW domain-containing protein YfiP